MQTKINSNKLREFRDKRRFKNAREEWEILEMAEQIQDDEQLFVFQWNHQSF